jgi:hypothetical protein
MINLKKICKKCGKPKRTVKKPLCDDCYANKNFTIWKGHSASDIVKLIDYCQKWINKVENLQYGNLFIEDIGILIEMHDTIFRRYNNYERLSAIEQYKLMWRDIKKFIIVAKE